MIIVAQDKWKIVNFNNVLAIWIDDNVLDETEPAFTINADTDGTSIELGYYKTEERAKGVLQEIIKSYREYRTAVVDGYTNILEETAVYEIPER